MKGFLTPFATTASLRRLRALTALVERGSVSAAAETLHVTPPAVSLQLRQLEDDVGLPLVERTRTGVHPTEAGREILAAAERIELALQECAAALDALKGMHGAVAVGVISTAKYFMPRALATFAKQHPSVEMRIMVGNREEMLAALAGFELDLAITGRPPEEFATDQAVIGDHPHVVIAAPDHPLASARGIPLASIAAETFLLREAGSGTRALVRRLFDGAGVEPRVAMQIGSNESIKQTVMAGLGVALISAHTIAVEIADRRLVVLDVEGLPVVRQWYVIKRREKRLLPVAQALWTFLAEEGGRFLPAAAARAPAKRRPPASADLSSAGSSSRRGRPPR
jgi:LysR family transcriptional regulator for metE and metH